MPELPARDALDQARTALRRGAWEDAVAAFRTVLDDGESAEAREAMGTAAWWLDDAALTLESRERAYRLYRDSGDERGAARMAVALAWDSILFGGTVAVARGWLGRARIVLDRLEPCPEHGWLAVREAEIALRVERDVEAARHYAARAVAFGESLGLPELEIVGGAIDGLASVNAGEVDDGMRKLDEAVAAATSGELDDLMWVGKVCCFLIYACEGTRDYARAVQWCEWVTDFCERWNLRPLFSVCRTQYASVLIARGRWEEAEDELEHALGQLRESRRALVGEGVVRLAELRRRQGRLDEAEELFGQVEFHRLSRLGRAALALDRGDPQSAVELADGVLRRTPTENRVERAAAVELVIRAELARGDVERAREGSDALAAVAVEVGTEPLRGSAALAAGMVAAARGDDAAARPLLEDAVELLERSCGPYEAADARTQLARSLRALGREDDARRQEAAAAAALERLRGPARPAHPDAVGGLTPRETEVLRLVAQGGSNRDIAAALVLSEHTVHRHVANILRKLRLGSRAAAAAEAARLGLV